MAELILYPETIDDTEISTTGSEGVNLTIDSSADSTESKTTEIKDQSLPTAKIAVELISTSLNTKSQKILGRYSFTESGAIQIGTYEAGQNGDIRISPSGIIARNSSGITTFTLDGETGDAVFSGTIQTGTLISGDVVVGDNAVRIDGTNRRMLFYSEETGEPMIHIGF